jgi:hypothetical protein
LVGFEEPDPTLLLVSTVALLVPVFVIFVHLAFTRELSPEQRKAWLRELTGRHALWAWTRYLTCSDRREAVNRIGDPERRQ